MNIFYLSHNPEECAKQHVDKHVVKMILEYAQLLSTAHRVLDGNLVVVFTDNNRKKKVYKHPDNELDEVLYKSTHINHPSAKWVMASKSHYDWLYNLFYELCHEYQYRYGKQHLTDVKLSIILVNPPKNIPNKSFEEPYLAMPDQYKVPGNAIRSYQNYYNGDKQLLAKWKLRDTPVWYDIKEGEE